MFWNLRALVEEAFQNDLGNTNPPLACAHRLTCRALRFVDVDLNLPTKRVLSFAQFAALRRKLHEKLGEEARPKRSDAEPPACRKALTRIIRLGSLNRCASNNENLDSNSGSADSCDQKLLRRRQKHSSYFISSGLFKKKPPRSFPAWFDQVGGGKSSAGNSAQIRSQTSDPKHVSGLRAELAAPDIAPRLRKPGTKKLVLENKLKTQALLWTLESDSHIQPVFKSALLSLPPFCEVPPARESLPGRLFAEPSSLHKSRLYPNSTVPNDQANLSTLGKMLESTGRLRVPRGCVDRVLGETGQAGWETRLGCFAQDSRNRLVENWGEE